MQNFEDGTRVPLLLRVPGTTDKGMRTSALVELIDVYPTLSELAGIEQPELCPVNSKVGVTSAYVFQNHTNNTKWSITVADRVKTREHKLFL